MTYMYGEREETQKLNELQNSIKWSSGIRQGQKDQSGKNIKIANVMKTLNPQIQESQQTPVE